MGKNAHFLLKNSIFSLFSSENFKITHFFQAQAQECLVQKSLLDNRSAIVIAKLSLWLQEAYDSAAKIVDEWSVNIPESVQRVRRSWKFEEKRRKLDEN